MQAHLPFILDKNFQGKDIAAASAENHGSNQDPVMKRHLHRDCCQAGPRERSSCCRRRPRCLVRCVPAAAVEIGCLFLLCVTMDLWQMTICLFLRGQRYWSAMHKSGGWVQGRSHGPILLLGVHEMCFRGG